MSRKERLNATSFSGAEPKVRVVYVEPISTGSDSIGFERFAYHVAKHGDPLSERFAASLLRWCGPAGQML